MHPRACDIEPGSGGCRKPTGVSDAEGPVGELRKDLQKPPPSKLQLAEQGRTGEQKHRQ